MDSSQYDIIIIGAGAAGLMAMHELLNAGYKVCLLEASDKPGGRMATINSNTGAVLETGAEFIHGKAPLTKKLLSEASITFFPVSGKMFTIRNGIWFPEDAADDSFEKFKDKLDELNEDCSIDEFLDKYFPSEEYEQLRNSITGLAEGFDLADTRRASVYALKKELAILDEEQFRIEGGYRGLVHYLLENKNIHNAGIFYNKRVHTIMHEGEQAIAFTDEGKFSAKKIIVTVSAGILQSGEIKFQPASTLHEDAIRDLGYGAVIKVLLCFKTPFWFDKFGDTGFFLTDEIIPTWWTQLPKREPLLTGWFGGPKARAMSTRSDDDIYDVALESLSHFCGESKDWLAGQVIEHHIYCWSENKFTKGAYSYNTVQSSNAKRLLEQPIANKIYFAGEAIYSGESQGTVEAALSSGRDVALDIISKGA